MALSKPPSADGTAVQRIEVIILAGGSGSLSPDCLR